MLLWTRPVVLGTEVVPDLQRGAWWSQPGDSSRLPCPAGSGTPAWRRPLPTSLALPPSSPHTTPPSPADAPSALNDVIYTLLVVAIGVTAFNERRLGE